MVLGNASHSASIRVRLWWRLITGGGRHGLLAALFLGLTAISGCAFRDVLKAPVQLRDSAEPKFEPFYSVLDEVEPVVESGGSGRAITLTASKMPFNLFLRYLADNANISIVCDQDLDEKNVTINVTNTDVRDVLASVARRYGVDITEQGGVYYVGALKPQDRAILVRKVRRLSSAEIMSMTQTLISDVGRCATTPDGLTVIGDRVRVLQNINEMFDSVERAKTNTWVVQLYLISGNVDHSRELGFDTTATFDVAATIASAKSKVDALGVFNAVLKSAKSDKAFEIIAQPMMLLTDGGGSNIQDGETIPIPKRTVSDSGTVTTTGYDYVKTGLVIKTNLREMSPTSAVCGVDIEMTQVTSMVDSAPVTSGQSFQASAVLESGGTYLIGSLSRQSSTRDKRGAFVNTFFGTKNTAANIEVWLRCYRIRGGYQRVVPISASPDTSSMQL